MARIKVTPVICLVLLLYCHQEVSLLQFTQHIPENTGDSTRKSCSDDNVEITQPTFSIQPRKLKIEEKALEGFLLMSKAVNSDSECFTKCIEDDCRCVSFNFKTTADHGKHKCELNYEDKSARDLMYKRGWRYYDITAGKSPPNSCVNSCCHDNPCQNGGVCTPICGSIKRFNCSCASGFTGRLCETPKNRPLSCLDILRRNRSAVSGSYQIKDHKGKRYKVFCDMNIKYRAAWTLIESFSLANSDKIFHQWSFEHDNSVNEGNPEMNAYRLSRGKMMSLRETSTHWKATCEYQKPGKGTGRDYVRGNLEDLDILKSVKSDTEMCEIVNFINVEGIMCQNCTVLMDRRVGKHMSVKIERKNKCSFHPVLPKNLAWSYAFGYYGCCSKNFDFKSKTFSCTSTNHSTTQWWLGGFL